MPLPSIGRASRRCTSCGDTPAIVACCCHMSNTSEPSTPPESRTEVQPSIALHLFSVDTIAVVTPLTPIIERPVDVSPRASLLDLTTLFSTLLI
ncbi:MAG: hypothetical protein QM736_20845 [Vicinamibacterales bacterium]